MSEIVKTENCLQLILQNSELVLDENEINAEEFSDILYPDGTRAILVNGHILHPEGTVILQEDLTHLYVEGDNGQLLLADNQDLSSEATIDASKIIEFIDVDNGSNLVGEEPQIVYITEDSLLTQEDSTSQYHLTENTEDNDLVETQVIDLEEFMKAGKENIFELLEDENRFQYAVLKDGKLHTPSEEFIPSLSSDDSQSQSNQSSADNTIDNEQVLDISLITGKNLLTGQKVTLHSYMDKIQKQLKNGITPTTNTRKRKVQTNDLNSLLNKKLNIGTTTEGKRLVGKIVKVTKKNSNGHSEIVQSTESTANNNEQETPQQITDSNHLTTNNIEIVQEDQTLKLSEKGDSVLDSNGKISDKDSFQPITKTLEGLMVVENVRKKLENKTVIVKIVERNKSEKNISYMCGYMKNSVVINGNGTSIPHWNFIATSSVESPFKHEFFRKKKSPDVANVTLVITYLKKNERVIRVVLNPTSTQYVCSKCPRVFKSRLQLRIHKNSVHKILTDKPKEPKILEKNLSPPVEETRTITEATNGVLETIYFQCGVCFHNFASTSLLTEHLKLEHSISHPYVCYTCGKCYNNMGDLNHHKKEHVSVIKYYQCDRCKRTFTRYSNLQRHLAIHKGAEQMYQCSICGCSYHYVSSLTKHIVQNHIQTKK